MDTSLFISGEEVKNMIKKVCNVLSTMILIMLICIVGILFVPRLLGMDTLAVISGSMEPNIPVGSLIIIDETSFESLKVGDVITYKMSDSTVITHRIKQIDTENKSVITKGDANEVEDGAPVSSDRIIGKLKFSIPLIGYLTIYMQTPLGIAIICGIVFVLLFLYYLPTIFENDK